ncbi:MAG: M4 family metallopeptidase [Bacillota bacterium]
MKRFVAINVILALIISSFMVTTGFAAGGDKAGGKTNGEIKIKKFMKSDMFDAPGYVSGSLTLPSKEKPEKIVKKYVGADSKDKDVVVHKNFKNEQNETIIKTEQIYKGIKVRGTFQSFIIDEEGVIKTVSGTNIPDIEKKVKGKFEISENDALAAAMADINREVKETSYNSVEKIFLPRSEGVLSAYSVKISFVFPAVESWEYIIDASTGKIIEKNDALRYESVQVTGKGPFGDTRTLNGYRGTIPDVNITPRYEYSLADLARTAPAGVSPVPFKILTYDMTTTEAIDYIYPGDLDNYREISSDNDGVFTEDSKKYHDVDAHYFTGKTYEYFKNKFGRYSFDDKGRNIIINCHALFLTRSGTTSPNNACFDPWARQFYLGDGDGEMFSTFATPETIGHELTHGIIDNDAMLAYFYQSGAIHEGLADFFGEAIESYAYGTAPDWKKMVVGYTPNTPDDAYLDYKNPQDYGCPGHMEDILTQPGDNIGVHDNAAILTKAFSLMSDGGWHRTVAVEGIGLEKVANVMYKVINEYLSANTNFAQFAEASVDAATKLYGEGSREYYSIRAGLHAVGILNSVSQWNRVEESTFELLADTFTTCQLGSKVYVMGGCKDEAKMEYSTEVWEYDLINNKWTRKSDMIGPRIHAESVAANNKIYLLYGQDDIFNETVITRIDQFDPATNTWTAVADLPNNVIIPSQQYSSGSTITKSITKKDSLLEVKTGLIEAGGSISIKIQGSKDNQTFVDVQTFEPITASNSTVKLCFADNSYYYYRVVTTVNGAPCTFGVTGYYYRQSTEVVSYDNKLYVIGGSDFANELNYKMDIFDTVTNQWTLDLPGLLYSKNDPVATVTTVDSVPMIYVFFGERFGSASTHIEVYNLNTGYWNLEGYSPSDITTSNPAVAVYKGKIHFVGGNETNSFLLGNGTTIVYDPQTKIWNKDVIPGVASVNGTLAAYDSHLYHIGSLGGTVGWVAPLAVDIYEPLRIDAYENSNAIVVQWSKYDTNTSTDLVIDGSSRYTGTATSYRDISYYNQSKKHTMKVTQNHPLYGTISSKTLCSVYQVIGDLDQDNGLSAIDIYLLEDYIRGISPLTNAQKVAADINKDNTINNVDLDLLSAWVYNNDYSNQRIGRAEFIIYGDVNNDGDIDLRDYNILYDAVLNSTPLSYINTLAADVDGNGKLNTTDCSYIKRYYLYDDIIFPAVNN